jgi:adenylylsulfate kinase-like enzyme
MVIWLIGLSGVGKTTIGRRLHVLWQTTAANTVFVDGDEIRKIFGAGQFNHEYSLAGRRRNAERITAICSWLDRQDINVVACVLSVFQDNRDWNRENYSDYFEVFIDAPMEVLRKRHPRDLYGMAERGEMPNVVGVDIPWTPPLKSDLVIDNGDEADDADALAKRILDAAMAKALA